MAKRFLTFYLITGLGAALTYLGYIQFQINALSNNIDPSQLPKILDLIKTQGADMLSKEL